MRLNILQDLPKETKIMMDDDIKKIIFGEEKLSILSIKFNIKIKNLSRYRNKSRAIPLGLFIDLVQYRYINIEDLQNHLQIKVNKTGEYLRIGPFVDITPRWVYIAELLKGDGHISKNFWYIVFVNKEDSLISEVRNFFLSIGLSEKRFSLNEYNGCKFLTIRSYLIAYLLYKIFGVLPGNKSSKIDIYDFVIDNLEFGIAAVRGAFDSEGSVTFTGSRRISITSNSVNWLKKLQSIMNQLKINSTILSDKSMNRCIYRLFIHGIINIKRFEDKIKPLHEKRKVKLKEIINSYWKNPEYIFHKDILLAIQKGIDRKRDISKELKLDLITLANNIYKLRKNNYIEPYKITTSNQGAFFNYKITNKGEEYLEKELIPFFD